MNMNAATNREFERERPRLQALARRMLGSDAEAEDAVQEAWLRLDRTDAATIKDLAAWLTTVTSRVCLNELRARKTRREDLFDQVPDPVISRVDGPHEEVELAEDVEIALSVVLDTLSPAERVAFVLHDLFGVAFGEIGTLLDRTPEAVRQLASRARRRVRVGEARTATDRTAGLPVVEAFIAAARSGDLAALVAVLDPDVVVRADMGAGSVVVTRGAKEVGSQALRFADEQLERRPVTVNGLPGIVNFRDGQPFSVLAFRFAGQRIKAIDILADPDRIARLDLASIW